MKREGFFDGRRLVVACIAWLLGAALVVQLDSVAPDGRLFRLAEPLFAPRSPEAPGAEAAIGHVEEDEPAPSGLARAAEQVALALDSPVETPVKPTRSTRPRPRKAPKRTVPRPMRVATSTSSGASARTVGTSTASSPTPRAAPR